MAATKLDNHTLMTLLAGMLVVLAICGLMVLVGVRRVVAVRRELHGLSERHEAAFSYLSCRMAAQKAQVAADQATGEERAAHLRQAIELWRDAYRNRPSTDAYTGQFISDQITMLEGELAATEVPSAALEIAADAQAGATTPPADPGPSSPE